MDFGTSLAAQRFADKTAWANESLIFLPTQAVNFVRKRLSVHHDIDLTAVELVQKAIERGTRDNTTVVIVVFHQSHIMHRSQQQQIVS